MGIFNGAIELYHESNIEKIGRYLDKALRVKEDCGCDDNVEVNSSTANSQLK